MVTLVSLAVLAVIILCAIGMYAIFGAIFDLADGVLRLTTWRWRMALTSIDKLMAAIRIEERVYARLMLQRDNTPTWLARHLECARRLGALRLQTWKHMKKGD